MVRSSTGFSAPALGGDGRPGRDDEHLFARIARRGGAAPRPSRRRRSGGTRAGAAGRHFRLGRRDLRFEVGRLLADRPADERLATHIECDEAYVDAHHDQRAQRPPAQGGASVSGVAEEATRCAARRPVPRSWGGSLSGLFQRPGNRRDASGLEFSDHENRLRLSGQSDWYARSPAGHASAAPHMPRPPPLRPRVEGIEQMGIGPVQYMVVAFPGNKFKGKSPPRSKSS